MLLALCAFSSLDMGDGEQAEEYLRQARDQAARFDAAPDCTLENVRFIVPSQSAAYDDFGATAADGVRQLLEENREEYPSLLEQWEKLNREENAAILMVTHDAYTASYSSRVLFIKDGRLFHELRRGKEDRKAFFEQIMNVTALMGGDLNYAV